MQCAATEIVMESKMNKTLLIISLSSLFAFNAEAKIYKWVDDKGVTHMGDTIPAEYANKDRAVLNKTGRVVNTTDVLTPEERAAKEAEDAKVRAEKEVARNRKIHDSSLINTYSNVAEIDQARKRNLLQIDARAQVAAKQLSDANKNLSAHKTRADEHTRSGKSIPAYLQEELENAQAAVDKLNRDMNGINAEKAALEARYDADKARYRELTGK